MGEEVTGKKELEALGLSRGIIMGLTEDGTTRSLFIGLSLAELTMYVKLLELQIFESLKRERDVGRS